MSKRPAIDLMALTTEQAAPMPEAMQRMPVAARQKPLALPEQQSQTVKTPNLEPLAFKVSPAFRKRFRQRAVSADLKLNQLLFEALDAWEEKHGVKKLEFENS
jgi:hypothetical protein